MVKVIIGAEVKVEGLDKAGQSVGSFKKQLKEAQLDVLDMANKFGLTSTEAQNAAMKVARLKDAIGDAKQLSDTFNPDKKFVALGGALQGVTAGFAAYSGAMGLLGAESKEIEKLLLKVQSAMALQQGIAGIAGAIDSFKLLANTVKTKVVGAFSTLKGAILATGLGALVIAIVAVYEAMTIMADRAEAAAEATKKLNEETQRFSEIGLKGELDYLNKKEKLDVAKAKLAGKTESEIFAIQQDFRRQRIEALRREYEETQGIDVAADATKLAAIKNAIVDGQVAEAENVLRLRKIREDASKDGEGKNNNDEIEKARKKQEELLALKKQGLLDELAAIQAYGVELAEEDNLKAEAERERLAINQEQLLETKVALAELALLEDPDSIDNRLAKEQADFDLEMAQFEGNNIQRQVLEKEHSQAVVDIKAEEVEAKKKLEEIELQQQMELVDGIAGALNTLADIAGRQTTAGKVLAIAVTTINTIKGAISAFTGMSQQIPGPVGIALGVVAAAGVVASGVKAVKQITAVKIPRGGSVGGGVGSISLPNAPLTPQAQTTRLDQGSINAVGNAASRAYVLETDVSGNQERIRRLNRAAKIN